MCLYLLLLPLLVVLNPKINYQNWCQSYQLCFLLGVFWFQILYSVWFFCLQFSSFHNTIYWRGFIPLYILIFIIGLLSIKMWIYFWALYSVPLIYVSFFMPLPCCSDYDIAVQSLSHVWLFATPWTAESQTSLSFTISQSLLKLVSVESVMTSNRLILGHPLLLLPSILSSIRVFFNEPPLCIRWPKY